MLMQTNKEDYLATVDYSTLNKIKKQTSSEDKFQKTKNLKQKKQLQKSKTILNVPDHITLNKQAFFINNKKTNLENISNLPEDQDILNFKAGDQVIYPSHGVGIVQKRAFEEIAGYTLDLIYICFDNTRMILRVPINKAIKIGLRKLANLQTVQQALSIIEQPARAIRTIWIKRAREYSAQINSGDLCQIAQVVRDLAPSYFSNNSFSERIVFEQAMDRLCKEIACIQSTDQKDVNQAIMNLLA